MAISIRSVATAVVPCLTSIRLNSVKESILLSKWICASINPGAIIFP